MWYLVGTAVLAVVLMAWWAMRASNAGTAKRVRMIADAKRAQLRSATLLGERAVRRPRKASFGRR